MTKPELIAKIAEKTNLSKKQAAAAVATLTGTITETLKAEGKVAIPSLVYCLSISCTLSAVLIDRIFALLAIINGIILQFAGFFALIDWYIS